MNIDSLVNLTIDVQDQAVVGSDLGTPLLLGYHTHSPKRVGIFAKPGDMLDAGFSPNDYLVQMATALKSQDSAPPLFKVGRRATPLTQTIQLTPTELTVGFVHAGNIAGQAYAVEVLAADNLATLCTRLAAAIDAIPAVAAIATATHVTVTADPGTWVFFDVGRGSDILDLTPDTTTDDDLFAIEAEDDDWYGLLSDASSPASITLLANFIQARRKLCIVQSPDSNILDPSDETDIASTMLASGFNRTFGIYHRKIGGPEWLAAAWMSGRLTAQPGSETWAFKQLSGVSTDKLSASAETALARKNWNHYTRTAKVNMTFDGKSGAGRYGDVVRFIDWLHQEIQLAIVQLLVSNKKVPYTDAGAAAVKSVIAAVLERGIRIGGLARDPSPVVTVPRVSDVPQALRAQRILPDVTFRAVLAGAIHGVVINGTVSVAF